MGGGLLLYIKNQEVFKGGFSLGVGEGSKIAELAAVHELLRCLASLLETETQMLLEIRNPDIRTVLNIYMDSKNAMRDLLNYSKGIRNKNHLLVQIDQYAETLFHSPCRDSG